MDVNASTVCILFTLMRYILYIWGQDTLKWNLQAYHMWSFELWRRVISQWLRFSISKQPTASIFKIWLRRHCALPKHWYPASIGNIEYHQMYLQHCENLRYYYINFYPEVKLNHKIFFKDTSLGLYEYISTYNL